MITIKYEKVKSRPGLGGKSPGWKSTILYKADTWANEVTETGKTKQDAYENLMKKLFFRVIENNKLRNELRNFLTKG